MSYNTSVTYVAAAGQTQFDVPFPYLSPDHVLVTVNAVTVQYSWVTQSRIALAIPCTADQAVVIQRNTPIGEALVTFQNGAVLTKDELNTSVLQCLYIQQELSDLYNAALGAAEVRLGNNLGIVTPAENVLDELAQMVLSDQLLANLQQRIADLDLTAEGVIRNALDGHDLSMGVTVIQGQVTQLQTDNSITVSILDLLAIKDASGQSVVLQESTVKRGDGTTLAEYFANVQSSLDANNSAIQTTETAQTSTAGALAELTQALGAYDSSGNGAFILNDLAVKLADGTVQANAVSGLLARMGTAEANVTTNATAIADESSARATAISSVQASIGAANSSIDVVQTAIAGLNAKYGVVLDVNGYITGYEQNNNGSSGNFIVLDDTFQVVNPAQGAPITALTVSGGWLLAPKIRAGDVYADTITANHIVDLSITTPKMADNSITNGASSFTSGQSSVPVGQSLDLQTAVLTTSGGRVQVAFSTFSNPYTWSNGGPSTSQVDTTIFDMNRDGSTIVSFQGGTAYNIGGGPWQLPGGLQSFVTYDTPPPGLHVYTVTARTSAYTNQTAPYLFRTTGLNLLEIMK